MSDLRTRLIRLAHSNPELRPHVLPLVAAAKLPVADLAKMMAERVVRTDGYADEAALMSSRFVVFDWARANNLEISRSTVDALIEALLETAVTWGKPKVDVGAMTKVLQQYAAQIVPKKSP